MKLLWQYTPEIVTNAAGFLAAMFVTWPARGAWRIAGGLVMAGLGLNALVSIRGLLGLHPDVDWMMARGVGFAVSVCLAWSAMLLWFWRRAPKQSFSPRRRRLAQAALCGAMGIPVAATGYGAFVGRKQFRLVEVDLAIPGLERELDGLKLVQLTDIHLSPFLSRAELGWCVDMANETRAAYGLVTGDLVTGTIDEVVPCLEELRRLKCTEGIYGCMGNHERYLEAEDYTAQEGRRRGIEFLRGEGREVRVGGARLNFVGVDFRRRGETDLGEVAHLRRPGMANLLLCHNPALFPKAQAEGWDLVIAGHTHGGQVDFEIWNRHVTPVRMSTPYIYGQYREGGSLMYVSRGIGTVGVPARVGAPPEVALLRLRRA